jgi:hypothetical protein
MYPLLMKGAIMDSKKAASLILEKWIASLPTRDRGRANVANNFDELFQEWFNSHVSFEDAHALLEKAIKAHQPSASTVKHTYKRLRGVMDKSEK